VIEVCGIGAQVLEEEPPFKALSLSLVVLIKALSSGRLCTFLGGPVIQVCGVGAEVLEEERLPGGARAAQQRHHVRTALHALQHLHLQTRER
jgi:hypothetical protein